jgi:DNA-binding YbaB/EbfC family protein
MPGVDLNYFIRQANKLTTEIEARKTALADETVEGKAADGLVVAVANGVQELRSIKIDKKALEGGDVAMLEDLVTAAVNAALTASKAHMQAELGKVSSKFGPGLKIPGLM